MHAYDTRCSRVNSRCVVARNDCNIVAHAAHHQPHSLNFDAFLAASCIVSANRDRTEGTKFAFQRFGYYSPSGGQYLVQWAKRDGADEFSKNCIKDAFSAEPVAAQAD